MIITVAQTQLFILALTRILAVLVHIPILGSEPVPIQTRVTLGIALTFFLVPWQPIPAQIASMDLVPFAINMGREFMVGTLSGFAASLTFGVILIAAEVMGLGSGFGSQHVLNPTMGASTSAYNQFFVMVATLFFLLINGHHWLLIALQRSFEVVPLNGGLTPTSPDALLKMTSQLIAAGIQLALPVLCALLLTDVTLGMLAKVAPQVQVFFLGLPLKVGVALIALSLTFAGVFPLLTNLFQQIPDRMFMLITR